MTCIEKRGVLGGTCLNVGCIPSKSLLNNSHLYHQILHDTKNRGIEVGDVKLNLANFMKAKDTSVTGLTKGIEYLFKKNNVEYIKGTGSLADENTIAVKLNDGGEIGVRGKNIIIATGSEATPFPGLTIDEKKVVTSTGAIALQEVPKKMVVIGGGIIGLEMVCSICYCHLNSLLSSTVIGFRLVSARLGSYGRRIPWSDWWSWNGCGDLQDDSEDLEQARHEIQAQHKGHQR